MHNKPFENNRSRANEILELIHTDLNGPHTNTGIGGEKYFLTFIDDFSKLGKIYCIKSKAEVINCFIEYVNLVENITGKKVKNIRCDNGKEYINSNVYKCIREKGIRMSTCPPYVHELNGVAERYNRSVMDVARCLLIESKVQKMFWPEIVKAAAYLKNRTLANTIEKKTPYEIFFNVKPDVKYLKMYGSKVFVRKPEQIRKSKWDNKATMGTLLGYTDTGYRVLINRRIIDARHVDIIEKDVRCIGVNDTIEITDNDSVSSDNESLSNSDIEPNNEVSDTTQNQRNENIDKLRNVRRSSRIRKPNNNYYNENFETQYVYVNYSNANTPSTYEEALSSIDSDNWKSAMNRELQSLIKNKTWKLVNRPQNKRVIDVKWVYKKKNENTFKARLVVKGFQQRENIDNTYSPIAKMQTLKLLLAFCCQYGLNIEQMDVETAFLNGKISTEVYVNQPKGYEEGTDKVFKLRKSLYGLRESPRAWYECFHKTMTELNFKRSDYDYCLYVKLENNVVTYVLIFVDDLLICSINDQGITEVKCELMKRFHMKDLGKIRTYEYIGIDINYDPKNNNMTLSQINYIESLATKYRLENAKLYTTPMETNLKLQPAKEINTDIKYRNLIGELFYISTGTRPDVTYCVNYLSRFQNCYDKTHFKYALRILKYLYQTKDIKLTYKRNVNAEILDCFVDAVEAMQ